MFRVLIAVGKTVFETGFLQAGTNSGSQRASAAGGGEQGERGQRSLIQLMKGGCQ